MFISRNAVFVDAVYLFAQGGVSLTGSSLPRIQLQLNESEIVNQLKSIAIAGNMPLLRIYWYDGARGGMTPSQSALADMADVKVRLGYINSAGEQKGVDSLILTDLIDLARNQAISDAYIVTADGDMRIAVQIAQSFGVRVHLINLEPAGVSLNPQLRQEVDTLHEISRLDVAKFLQIVPQAPLTGTIDINASVDPKATIESATKQAITTVFTRVTTTDLQKLKAAVASGNTVPPPYDGHILGTCRSILGRDLEGSERKQMRRVVLEWLKQ
jgi:hypothetical protein